MKLLVNDVFTLLSVNFIQYNKVFYYFSCEQATGLLAGKGERWECTSDDVHGTLKMTNKK